MDGWKDFKTEDRGFALDSEVMEVMENWLKATAKSFFF
jgi:hypothetical protein